MEIIRIVESFELGANRTLKELSINKSTCYRWYARYRENGDDGLAPSQPMWKFFWNQIPQKERQKVVETALGKPDLSPRELAHHIADKQGWFISESSVYRILKARGLITSPTNKHSTSYLVSLHKLPILQDYSTPAWSHFVSAEFSINITFKSKTT